MRSSVHNAGEKFTLGAGLVRKAWCAASVVHQSPLEVNSYDNNQFSFLYLIQANLFQDFIAKWGHVFNLFPLNPLAKGKSHS